MGVPAGHYERYRLAGREGKNVILSEFCANIGYHRKYAIPAAKRSATGEAAGAAVRRVYDPSRTALERVRACAQADGEKVARLEELRKRLDPFQLGRGIERKLRQLSKRANRRWSPKEHEGTGKQSARLPRGQRLWKRRAETALGNQNPISTLPQPQQQQKPSVTFQMSRQHNLRLHS